MFLCYPELPPIILINNQDSDHMETGYDVDSNFSTSSKIVYEYIISSSILYITYRIEIITTVAPYQLNKKKISSIEMHNCQVDSEWQS